MRHLGKRPGWDAAPDLVQEVFVRAASSEQTGRLINPAAFVRPIARNLLIDRARKIGRDDVVSILPPPLASSHDYRHRRQPLIPRPSRMSG